MGRTRSVSERLISICPVAFGEVDVKGRVKSILNYEEPSSWFTVGVAVLCAALALFFLTDPIDPAAEPWAARWMRWGSEAEVEQVLITPCPWAGELQETVESGSFMERMGGYFCTVADITDTSLYLLDPVTYKDGELTEIPPFTVTFDEAVVIKAASVNADDPNGGYAIYAGTLDDLRETKMAQIICERQEDGAMKATQIIAVTFKYLRPLEYAHSEKVRAYG